MLGQLKSRVGNERGSVLVLVVVTMVLLLVMGGLAIDLAYVSTARNEIVRSLDAAALAGAGNLGFNDTVFPAVRGAAQAYAASNPQRMPGTTTPITLDLNTGNAPGGNIVLGVWSGSSFTPSTDGSIVNAVRCQYSTQIPTSFLNLLGLGSFTVRGDSIAIANPPANPPPDACLFPIGVGSCPFQGGTSLGCGAPVTFITSSGQDGAGCLAPPCDNTAAWVNLEGGAANASYLTQAISQAGNGGCTTSSLQTGDSLQTSNGMVQNVMDLTRDVFLTKWAQSAASPHEIKDANGNIVYSGQGWKVYMPVIQTDCPAGAISGSRDIVGWTEYVITQVINNGQCAVANHWPGNAWDPVGLTPNCTGQNVPQNSGALRGIFGYYSCSLIRSNPVPTPAPRSALASRLRLVK